MHLGNKKKISKTVRGKMLCKNSKCQTQIPIHTNICKHCGFVNKKKSKINDFDTSLIEQLYSDHSKIDQLTKNQTNFVKEYFIRSLFEVSFFPINLQSRILTSEQFLLSRKPQICVCETWFFK